MQSIPRPDLLDAGPDPDVEEGLSNAEYRDGMQTYARRLTATRAYAERLWSELCNVRHYLVESLPPPNGSEETRTATRPDGPSDEDGWAAWAQAYIGVVACLEGPRGDSGYAAIEATQEAQARRSSTFPTATHDSAANPHETASTGSSSSGPAAVLDADPDAAAHPHE